MAKVKVKWRGRALYELRKAPGVKADLEERAAAIADAANNAAGGDARYETSSVQGKRKPQGRWRTTVITANAEAMSDNAKYDTLLSNLDAGK